MLPLFLRAGPPKNGLRRVFGLRPPLRRAAGGPGGLCACRTGPAPRKRKTFLYSIEYHPGQRNSIGFGLLNGISLILQIFIFVFYGICQGFLAILYRETACSLTDLLEAELFGKTFFFFGMRGCLVFWGGSCYSKNKGKKRRRCAPAREGGRRAAGRGGAAAAKTEGF